MKKYLAATAVAAMTLFTTQAHATLLVYEGFNYTTGAASGSGVLLAGQSGGTGMTGSWSTFNTGTANSVTVYQQGNTSNVGFSSGSNPTTNQFDGTVANLPTSGGYFGSVGLGGTSNTTDHIQAWRTLDPSVTATFTAGSTTWVSFVSARAFNLQYLATRFAIGAAELIEDRGHLANGEAIGVGGGLNSTLSGGSNQFKVFPQFWDFDSGTSKYQNFNIAGEQVATGASLTNSIQPGDYFYWEMGTTSPGTSTMSSDSAIPNIIVIKIVWSDSGPDVISMARFLESDGTITESMFNAVAISSAGWTTQPDLDQSQFDTISFAGGRYFADELRIATTFAEALGQTIESTPVPAPAALPAGLLLIAIAACRKRRA